MTQFAYNPCPKPNFGRGKLKRTQRSNLSAKETKRLYERSNRVCERCDRARASQRAHIERRWKSEDKPTAEDFVDLCVPCHRWADTTKEGREWLEQYRNQLQGVINDGKGSTN